VDTQNPTGYVQVLLESFSGTSGSSFEVTHSYVYGVERISERRNFTQNSQSATANAYYVYDGHGTVRALTDQTGAVTDTYDYDAFGNLLHQAGTTPNNYLYSGEQFDPDLGLYYNRARYLSVSSGRFWTMDTFDGVSAEPFSLHKYIYVSADPANRTDETGNDDLTTILGGTLPVAQILAVAVTVTLVAACSVYANLTGGQGPCGTSNRREGRMRIQLQLGDQFTAPVSQSLNNVDPPGVTIVQVRNGLQTLYYSAQLSIARFPFNRYQSEFFTAVIDVSQQAGRHAPTGYTGIYRSLLTSPIGDSGWRIDVDNLEGTNLRQ
jgi:RHS repeat-associated protein